MLKLADILDVDRLHDLMELKRINVQRHPTLPLRIFNYSNMAQFANEWSHEERVCRGLIVDADANVIARGPSKFFNFGQPGAPEVSLGRTVGVTNKEDGSLGIGWHFEGHYGVATRGSFASDQAVHATALLSEDDCANIVWGQNRGFTRIWEIVYPENRIVLNYGTRDELIPLGTVRNDNGIIDYRPPNKVKVMTFAEALELRIPDDREGYVLDILDGADTTGHLKLKGDRYKELHGAIFGLSERKIWESIGRGENMDEFVAALPDELQPWAQGVVDRIREDTKLIRETIFWAMQAMERHFGVENLNDIPRGEVARYIVANHKGISGPLFSLLDNKDDAVAEYIHKQLRPEHKLFRVESQDVN